MMPREQNLSPGVTLDYLNRCDLADFVACLRSVYPHADWVAARAAAQRPFPTFAALKLGLQNIVHGASQKEKMDLLCARTLGTGNPASTGINVSAPSGMLASRELEQVSEGYRARFESPFVFPQQKPDETSALPADSAASIRRRQTNQPDDEVAQGLRQLALEAERNLNHLTGHVPHTGNLILEWCELLSTWSDDDDGLTCAFMTIAHRKTAVQLATLMGDAGMEVGIDAVGNVVGRYLSNNPDAKTLMTGSHYDTGRHDGKLEGRLGILLPIAVVRHLHSHGEKLPFHLEVVGFSDAKGLRFNYPFLGSKAVAGRFDMQVLDHADDDGLSLRTILHDAGHSTRDIAQIARRGDNLLGFVEVALEGGPVLRSRGLPVGVVSSLAGSSRYLVELTGSASNAGSTPMSLRRAAVAAAAEVILLVERCCSDTASLVGMVCAIEIVGWNGSKVSGACRLTVDIQAAQDAARDVAVAAILNGIDAICYQRNMDVRFECLGKAPATRCDASLRSKLDGAVRRAGIDPLALAAGTVHDAKEMAAVTDVAMLFVRCDSDRSGRNSSESVTPDDIETAWQILLAFVRSFQSG